MTADAATGLDWMATRAYDPTTGRFISRDPLGRAPLFFSDNPSVYAGNTPLSNIDPSGQYRAAGFGSQVHESWAATKRHFARIVRQNGCDKACEAHVHQEWLAHHVGLAKGIDQAAMTYFGKQIFTGFGLHFASLVTFLAVARGTTLVRDILTWFGDWILGSSILTLAWAAENVAVITYDIVAAIALAFFFIQSQQSDSYWLDANNLASGWSGFGLTIALFGTLLVGLALPLLMLALPAYDVFWVGIGIGFVVGMLSVLRRVKVYIDQEEQALGYQVS